MSRNSVKTAQRGLHGEFLEVRLAFSASGYPFTSPDVANQAARSVWQADVDSDGDVDISDFLVLASNFDRQSARRQQGDLNADGRVMFSDFLIFVQHFGQKLPLLGDVNLDARVGIEDFLVLAANAGRDDANWTDGDLDGDGEVAVSDYLILSEHFGERWREPETPGKPKSAPNPVIFAEGSVYEYLATYTANDGSLLTESTVTITATGEPWPSQPDLQTQVIVTYSSLPEDKDAFSPHPLNPELTGWWDRISTGAIEGTSRVWMHPIRRNQFVSTEVAPFPDVRLPLEAGNTWSSKLPIPEGKWGSWGGTTVHSRYNVISRDTRLYTFSDTPLEVWTIEASSEFEFGTSTVTFEFHQQYGFVGMHYTNYVGETIDFMMTYASS